MAVKDDDLKTTHTKTLLALQSQYQVEGKPFSIKKFGHLDKKYYRFFFQWDKFPPKFSYLRGRVEK